MIIFFKLYIKFFLYYLPNPFRIMVKQTKWGTQLTHTDCDSSKTIWVPCSKASVEQYLNKVDMFDVSMNTKSEAETLFRWLPAHCESLLKRRKEKENIQRFIRWLFAPDEILLNEKESGKTYVILVESDDAMSLEVYMNIEDCGEYLTDCGFKYICDQEGGSLFRKF